MKLSGKILSVMVAFLPLAAVADEKGRMTCAIDDENATLSLTAGFSYSGEKPLFAVKGVLNVKGAGSQIAEQTHALKGKYLIQQWFYDQGFNLHFYIPARDGSFSFAIQTIQGDDGITYKGTYDFTIAGRDASFEPRGRDGNITCKMD